VSNDFDAWRRRCAHKPTPAELADDEPEDCTDCGASGVDDHGFDCTTCLGTGKIEK
jgi:hypothetical protein